MTPLPGKTPSRPGRETLARTLFGAMLIALLSLAGVVGVSSAQDYQGQVSQKRSQLDQARGQKGVLTTEIAAQNKKIAKLTAEVAELRNREAAVQAQLVEAEAELVSEQRNLEILRERVKRSVRVLQKRLVEIYKNDAPDSLTVLLESDGFEEVLGQYEYLQRIESHDADIVGRTRDLRDDARDTVERIRATRDAIRIKREELERTRASLEQREAALASARSRNQATLSRVSTNIQRLEGDIRGLEKKIQAQLAAAAAPAPSSSSSSGAAPAPLPAGPVRGGSGDMIWPVNGPMTSPFGPRWGRLHAGIDISAPGGTPIRAAKAGSIALAAWTGGYGNYTCINHGGGLSTCYAHMSSYEVTSGSVGQGDIIGYVGNTGASFGDHLHFEVRVGGVPTDPLGYL